MYPILFYYETYPIYSYGVCTVLGLIVSQVAALVPAWRAGRQWGDMIPMMMGVVVGGVVGMRFAHLLVEPDKLTRLLDFYGLFQSGTSGNIVGLMIGGYLGGLAIRWRFGLASLGNDYAIAFAIASVVWRIGCTLAGCCYGLETDLPWAIHLHGADRHPTMIYDGLFNLAMVAVLVRLRPRVTRDNQLLHLYFAAYAVFRFWLEYIRVYPPIAFGLTGVQWLCIAIVVWQAVRLWHTGRKGAWLLSKSA
jgi:prolipoprotein diacylglyceryltransferase